MTHETTTTTTTTNQPPPPPLPLLQTNLEFHGAAASSSPHSILFLPQSETVVYASECVINLARRIPLSNGPCGGGTDTHEHDTNTGDDGRETTCLHHVDETLRSATTARVSGVDRCVTCMAVLHSLHPSPVEKDGGAVSFVVFVCAFSDGTLTLWYTNTHNDSVDDDGRIGRDGAGYCWNEEVVRGRTPRSSPPSVTTAADEFGEEEGASITDVDGVYHIDTDGRIHVLLVVASSYGVDSYRHVLDPSHNKHNANAGIDGDDEGERIGTKRRIGRYPGRSVRIHTTSFDNSTSMVTQILLACGTAGPRSNRVHFYTARYTSVPSTDANHDTVSQWRYHGGVLGHLDWVTCLSFLTLPTPPGGDAADGAAGGFLLASGSQDARIRLWRIHPPKPVASNDVGVGTMNNDDDDGAGMGGDADNDSEEEEDDEDDDDGDAARMHIRFSPGEGVDDQEMESAVTLEALLIGHEDMVTSVNWRPSLRSSVSLSPPCLVSSSMDRSILVWKEEVTASTTIPDTPTDGDSHGTTTDPSSTPTTMTLSTTSPGLGNVWVPVARVGTAGGILGGSIGSSLLGFVNAVWNPDGTALVGHGYGGSVHFWTGEGEGGEEVDGGVERWRADPCITGHFRGVTDIDWEKTEGRYLLSVGADQTCRLWSRLPPLPTKTMTANEGTEDGDSSTKSKLVSSIWREVGRPQVHGYDLTSVVSIDTRRRRYCFVGGADEKEARVFEAPLSTVRLIDTLRSAGGCGVGSSYSEGSVAVPDTIEDPSLCTKADGKEGQGTVGGQTRVERAYIPSLGLSNRATAADAMEEGDGDAVLRSAPAAGGGGGRSSSSHPSPMTTATSIVRPSAKELVESLPHERDLGVTSLWPEVRKLFGHRTELVCLTSVVVVMTGDRDRVGVEQGKAKEAEEDLVEEEVVLVASSCKARDAEHAAIRVWDVHRGMCMDVLKEGHKSTVVALSFSPDGTYLASSGKDRRLCIWKRKGPLKPSSSSLFASSSPSLGYDLAAVVESAHKRIVWSVDFYRASFQVNRTSNEEVSLLATGSRDGFVKLWQIRGRKGEDVSDHDDGGIEMKELCRWRPSCEDGNKTRPVTAVSFAPKPLVGTDCGNNHNGESTVVLAVGTEDGSIELWGVPSCVVNEDGEEEFPPVVPKLLHSVLAANRHASAVTKLAWKPLGGVHGVAGAVERGKCFDLTLASCSSDHGVRILRVVGGFP